MIGIYKKVANAALRLTRNYDDLIEYRPESGNLNLMEGHTIIRYVHLDIPAQDVNAAIDRLIQKDYFRKSYPYMGGFMFSITDRLNHRMAFFWDDFSKKYWAGFITGFAASLAANLATSYVQSVIDKLFQLLQNLI